MCPSPISSSRRFTFDDFCAEATRSGYVLPSTKTFRGSAGERSASHSSSAASSSSSSRHRGALRRWWAPHCGQTSKRAAKVSAVTVSPHPSHLRKTPLPRVTFSLSGGFFSGQAT